MNNQNAYRPNNYSKDSYNQGSRDYKLINKQKRHREEENSFKYNNGTENHQNYKGFNNYSNKNYQKNIYQNDNYSNFSNGKHYLIKREDNRSHSRERKDYYNENHKKARYQDDHYERKYSGYNQSNSKDSLDRVERGERSERMERGDRIENRGERIDRNERNDRKERLERYHSNFSMDRGRSYEDYKQKSNNFSEDGDYSKDMRKNGGSFDLGKESQHEKEDYHNRYRMYNSGGNSYGKYYGGSGSGNMGNSAGNQNSSNNTGNIGGNSNKYEVGKNVGETSGQSLQELLSDDGQKEVIKSSLFPGRHPSKEAKEAMEPEEMIKKNSYNYDFSNNNSNNISKNDNKLNNNINNYDYSSTHRSQKIPSQYNHNTFQNQQHQTGFSSGKLDGKSNLYPNQSNSNNKYYQNNLNNMNNFSAMNNLNYSSLNLKHNSSSSKFSNENFINNVNDNTPIMQTEIDRVNAIPKSQSYQGKDLPNIFSPAPEIEKMDQSVNDLKSESSSAGDLGKKYYNQYNSHGIQAEYQKGNCFMKQGMSNYNYQSYNNLQGQGYGKQGYGGGQAQTQGQNQGYGFFSPIKSGQGFQLQNSTSNSNFNLSSNNGPINANSNSNGNNAYNTNMYPNNYLMNHPYQQMMNNNSQPQMIQPSKNTQVNIYLNNQLNKEFSREVQKSLNNSLPQEDNLPENVNNFNNPNNMNNVNNLNSSDTNEVNMNKLSNRNNINNFNTLSSNLTVPNPKETEEYSSIKVETNILTTLIVTRNAENRKNFDHLLSEALNDTVIYRENYKFSEFFKESKDIKGIIVDEVITEKGVKERIQDQDKQEDLGFLEKTPPIYHLEENKNYSQEKLMNERDIKTLKYELNTITKRRDGENLEMKKKKNAILRLELTSQILRTRQIEIQRKLEEILTEFN